MRRDDRRGTRVDARVGQIRISRLAARACITWSRARRAGGLRGTASSEGQGTTDNPDEPRELQESFIERVMADGLHRFPTRKRSVQQLKCFGPSTHTHVSFVRQVLDVLANKQRRLMLEWKKYRHAVQRVRQGILVSTRLSGGSRTWAATLRSRPTPRAPRRSLRRSPAATWEHAVQPPVDIPPSEQRGQRCNQG